jgi:hypothetical protein
VLLFCLIFGGDAMTDKFKALSSITAWVLFIFGFLRLLIGLVQGFMTGPNLPGIAIYLDFFVGVLSMTLAVVVMVLRRKMQ